MSCTTGTRQTGQRNGCAIFRCRSSNGFLAQPISRPSRRQCGKPVLWIPLRGNNGCRHPRTDKRNLNARLITLDCTVRFCAAAAPVRDPEKIPRRDRPPQNLASPALFRRTKSPEVPSIRKTLAVLALRERTTSHFRAPHIEHAVTSPTEGTARGFAAEEDSIGLCPGRPSRCLAAIHISKS